MAFADTFRGKRVLLTGHTGFKGAWLTEWLLSLGAEVHGLALPPTTEPALFLQAGLATRIHHRIGDIREFPVVRSAVRSARPDFVFHLAAQPLVRLSYEEPVATFSTNVLGTVHVLESVRQENRACVVVVVTTDKCYENKEWLHAYREDDPLGGHDPYSASKGATELVVAAYRRSYFGPGSGIRLASARAGNVIGGGDWAADRIMPDCIRALQRAQSIPVRNRVATRPWQHVLEPLSGYLWLAACLARPELVSPGLQVEGAFNFGPNLSSNRTVENLVTEVLRAWPGQWEDKSDPHAVHEAKLLNLATDKAHHLLNWSPVWDFERTVAETVDWYRAHTVAPGQSVDLLAPIGRYSCDAAAKRLRWTAK